MLFWLVIGLLLAFLLVGLAAGAPAAKPPTPGAEPIVERDEDPLDLLERNAPEALARYGTPETAEWLEAQGRGDELRGLGYRGPSD